MNLLAQSLCLKRWHAFVLLAAGTFAVGSELKFATELGI